MGIQIEKLEENKVKVTKTKKIVDIKGKEVEIFADEEAVEYGQSRIDNDRLALQGQIDFLNNVDGLRDAEVVRLQERLSDLDLIQEELNK